MTNSATQPSLKSWLVVFSAALFFFYEFVQLNLFNATNMELRAEFGLNASQISFISSTALIANLLLLLPAGLILDRVSTRKVIMVGLCVVISGTFGFAHATSVFQLGFFHFLAGFGNAFCFLSCMMLVVRWFPHRMHGTIIGLVVTVAFLGGVVAEAPLAYLVERYGWRNATLIDGVLGLVIFAIVWFNVQDHPKGNGYFGHSQSSQPMPFWQSLKAAVRRGQNLLAGLYTSLTNLPIMVIAAIWGAPYLVEVHGLGLTQAAFISSMIFIGSMFGCPAAGWISDTLGRRKLPMIIGAILSFIVSVMIIYIPDLTVTHLMVLFFMLGFFTSTQVISYPLITESNPKSISGVAMATASVIIMTGAALARNLFGFLMDYFYDGTVVNNQLVYSADTYFMAMHMYPIVMLIALVAVCFCRETYCRPQFRD